MSDVKPPSKEQWLKDRQDETREVTLDEVREALSTTIKEDEECKLITFLTMLLTYTDEDQQNIAFKSESCRGKSYIPLEIAEFFPQEDVIRIAYSSPTSFFHDKGEWDEENKVININLEKKILLFLDQPHDLLLQRLRPLLSHDQRTLTYKITDRKQKSGYRTKTSVIHGFPTVIFCTAKISIGEQERTRMFLLSPEASQTKLEESIELLAKRLGDRDAFKEWLKSHPQRKWLLERVSFIKDASIKNIVIPNIQDVCQKFLVNRENLIPRHQRDFPRLIAIIKALALLNCYQRKTDVTTKTITANPTDIQTGFKLYEKIVAPQELGVSPEVHEIYEKTFKPYFRLNEETQEYKGLARREILNNYYKEFHRNLSHARLTKEILPALESAGLIYEDVNPENRREKIILPTYIEPNNICGTSVGNTNNDLESTLMSRGSKEENSYPHSTAIYSFCELCRKPIHESQKLATDPSSHKTVHLECFQQLKKGSN